MKKNDNKSKKKIDIFKMTSGEIVKAYIDAKRDLLELELNSRREFVASFSSKRRGLKKNIARLMMFLHKEDNILKHIRS
jgi:ribosomal protein L29